MRDALPFLASLLLAVALAVLVWRRWIAPLLTHPLLDWETV
jgi:hypothetical protein